ncbi:MAG: hypothetical protein ISEC1_P1819 [Thiomicrorhabdus sp.]|nr:MAG: hypothetical protein ISEC1_P1819 [Thiomicrorhabdus sp.]
MKLVSVNIGKIQAQPWRDGTLSGLHKQAVAEVVSVGKQGLAGDEQADRKNHGGEDKAVFVMPESSYDLFKIGQPFGFLGENLTISGLDESQVCLGDRFQIGNVLLEVTQPRSPCWKLGAQAESLGDWSATDFLKTYSESGRVGFYCRVLAEGELKADLPVTWLTRDDDQAKTPYKISIEALFLAKQFHQTDQYWSSLQAVVNHPALSKSWQTAISQLISRREID